MEHVEKTAVYVLTSNSKDIYADMNLVSLWSLQYSNPDCNVVIAMDSLTMKSLSDYSHPILKENCDFVVANVDSEISIYRNRFIKTQIRNYVSGNFLYLDADTLIRDDLGLIFNTQTSIAGVPNHNGTGSPTEIPSSSTEFNIINNMGWMSDLHVYINGGVLYLSDNSDAYKFCDIWHKRWVDSSLTNKIYNDQPALNKALNECNIDFSCLAHRYNAQIFARPSISKNAAIWHIYSSKKYGEPRNIFTEMISSVKNDKKKVKDVIISSCSMDHPWLSRNWFDSYCIDKIHKSPGILNINRFEWLWLVRDYSNFFKKAIHEVRHLLK